MKMLPEEAINAAKRSGSDQKFDFQVIPTLNFLDNTKYIIWNHISYLYLSRKPSNIPCAKFSFYLLQSAYYLHELGGIQSF